MQMQASEALRFNLREVALYRLCDDLKPASSVERHYRSILRSGEHRGMQQSRTDIEPLFFVKSLNRRFVEAKQVELGDQLLEVVGYALHTIGKPWVPSRSEAQSQLIPQNHAMLE